LNPDAISWANLQAAKLTAMSINLELQQFEGRGPTEIESAFSAMADSPNLDKLVGKGRFRFIGFPLKIKGGTGCPIRAVAWLDD
jgi:hypothetical protein